MGGASRKVRYHYSLRLRTPLGDRERNQILDYAWGRLRATWSAALVAGRVEKGVKAWLCSVARLRVCTVVRGSCLCLPRTDSGGEFDWGGTSVKR